MADLYGTNARSSALESEDMSSFLRNLLHSSFTPPTSSSSSSSTCQLFKDRNKQLLSCQTLPPPLTTTTTSSSTTNLVCSSPIFFESDNRFKDRTSIAGSSVMVDSSAGFNFSDLGKCFMADPRECTRNTFSAGCAVDSDGISSSLKRRFPEDCDVGDFRSDCKNGPEASEAPVNPAPPSRSSKRSRAAEFHNLSEKRRRRRINEKLKALQNLIPNSNKTDKASMLDEAIEYLKQLQLQVQMLSMRNGLSLQPFCLTGSLHPTHLPLAGIGFNECNEVLNTNRREDAFLRNQGISVQASFDLPNQCTPSNQPDLTSQAAYIMNSETSFGLEPSIQNCYGPFNHLAPSKEHCQERLSQLPLDMSCAEKNTSAGVSS